MDLRVLGMKIRALRRARGYESQKEFARHLGMSYNHYGKLERGGNTTLKTLARIASALGTTPETLLCGRLSARQSTPEDDVLHEALAEYVARGEDERRIIEMLLFELLGNQRTRTASTAEE